MKKDEIQQGFDFDSRRQNSGLPKFRKRTKVGGRVRSAPKRTKASDVFFDNRINLITIEELANYIGVSSKTVQNWVALRSIPFLRIGRKTLFRRERIDSWLQTKEFEPCL